MSWKLERRWLNSRNFFFLALALVTFLVVFSLPIIPVDAFTGCEPNQHMITDWQSYGYYWLHFGYHTAADVTICF